MVHVLHREVVTQVYFLSQVLLLAIAKNFILLASVDLFINMQFNALQHIRQFFSPISL